MRLSEWLDVFHHCHEPGLEGVVRVAWPDGKCYLEQEAIVIDMFDLIRDELGKMRERNGQQRN